MEVFSSLVRALEAAANGASGGIISSGGMSGNSEGLDAPLAEKKKSLLIDDEEDDDDEDDDDDDDEGMEQQEQQQEEEEEAESDDEGDEVEVEEDLSEDELFSSSSPSFSPPSFSPLTAFVDDRRLGMLGSALLCAASGAAWVATVSAVAAVRGEGRRLLEERRRSKGGGGGYEELAFSSSSPSLLEPLAGAEGFKSVTQNPLLYYGVVSAADFVDK